MTIARVRVENQLSSEREKVVVAATASSSAGSAAMTLNSATMRMCSRAPGMLLAPRTRKADHLPGDAAPIIAMMSTTLTKRTTRTTSSRGGIGVRPVRIR